MPGIEAFVHGRTHEVEAAVAAGSILDSAVIGPDDWSRARWVGAATTLPSDGLVRTRT